jgi:hypothetical protein
MAVLDEKPQADRGGVPARRDQAAEMGPRRRRFVEMERLGVEFARERLDLVRGEGVAADLDAGADDEVLEKIHAPSFAAPRRANISVDIIRITGVPDWLRISLLNRMKPMSGRLAEARRPVTSRRSVRLSPARTGAR